ncbi:putative non-classical export protein 2 1 [Rosellinia necatrix]|uniref:Putative non-classical export protein 2 1 n=1 Tax=Rosellinia necatrix TaxID=77044 RepID=A0A1W2TSU7_ROSNE|nr:putative non-classical export protein 2 1 [Rosellinia necatrix]
MALTFAPIVHIVAAIFAIIELGLTAYWSSLYNSLFGFGGYSPSSVNFMIFNSVWSILVLIYIGLTPLYMTSVFHRLAALVLNVLTAIFWFAGSIAVAVGFGGPYECHDSGCSSAEAAIAFGFFLWAIFTFLAVIDGLESLRRRGHHVDTTKQTNAYPSA